MNAGQITVLAGGEELGGKLVAARARRLETRLALVDPRPGPAHQLPAGHLGLVDDGGDFAVVVAENLTQQEGRPLHRGERLEQHQKRHRQRVGGLGMLGRIGPGGGAEDVSPITGSGSHSPK